MQTIRFVAIFAILVFCEAVQVFAQPVPSRLPGSTHIFPAGGRRGTAIEVRVGAECIPPGTNFYLAGSGVSASDVLGAKLPLRGEPSPRRLPTEVPICYPKEWQAKIEIAADALAGPAYWRLSCAQGGTGSRPFVVGDLPEFIESESNSLPERAERVALPATINGQICGERDVDYFRLVGASGVVACEVLAARLGSPLDALVAVLDSAGKPIETERRSVGSDVVLAFRAEGSREYLLRVANVSEQGSPAHVYRVNVTLAKSVEDAFAREEASDGSRETEPNDSRDNAARLTVPAAIKGEFSRGGDEDWFALPLKAGETVSLACRPAPLGGAALPTLLLTDAAGKELAKAKSVDSSDGICRLEWKAPAEGEYRLRVRDLRTSQREASFGYRLTLEPARQDFALSLPADFVNVPSGGKAQIDVVVLRSGGFAGPIDLTLAGSSARSNNVKLDTPQIPKGASSFKVSLSAGDDVPSGSYTLRLVGRAQIGEQVIERTAAAKHLGVDALGIGVGSPTLDRLHVTVQHKPVFRLFCAEAYQYAHRGTVYGYLMEVERLNGFEGPIWLEPGDRQNRDLDGVEIGQIEVPPGQPQVMTPIYLPETMHINVQSQSQLYTQGFASFVDKHGRKQAVLVVSEKRNMLRTLPPVLKLKAARPEVAISRGASGKLRFELERTSNYRGPLEVQLVSSSTPAVRCEKGLIKADESAVEIPVSVAADAPHGVTYELRFRGTGNLSPSVTVVSEVVVRLRVD